MFPTRSPAWPVYPNGTIYYERVAAWLILIQQFNYLVRLWEAARERDANKLDRLLFAALCLQFALALAGNKNYQRCVSCGKWYELLPGVNRADKQTCSQTCRTRIYRQRKERALALHAEGKTTRAIARELDAKVDAVTKWITTEA